VRRAARKRGKPTADNQNLPTAASDRRRWLFTLWTVCYRSLSRLRRREHWMAGSHISVRKTDNLIRIDFIDRNILDEQNIHQIGEEILKIVESESRPRVVIVFKNVEHMSSAAFGTLMKVNERVKAREGQLRLCHITPRIHEAFVMTRLNRIFSIHDTFETAAASFA
jgi:anti-sigma B factor antagonist